MNKKVFEVGFKISNGLRKIVKNRLKSKKIGYLMDKQTNKVIIKTFNYQLEVEI